MHSYPDNQVSDDAALLDQMMADLSAAPAQYQPTNYWAAYTHRFTSELRQHGLRDFRRQDDKVFRAFGAVDFVHKMASVHISRNRFLKHLPKAMTEALDNWASRYLNVPDGLDFESYVELGYYFAKHRAHETNAKSIEYLNVSLAGNPRGAVMIEGRNYTRQSIQYYLQYASAYRHFAFPASSVVAELGSGMGRQTEIFAKLHPDVSLLLFDLPPQIYVAEQWLKSVFPGRVVSYLECRNMQSLEAVEPGKIYIFGNYQMPLLRTRQIDLFWNSASFHEMEPDIVAMYLADVNETAQNAYISENLRGGVKAKRPGDFGILQVTKLEDYQAGLPNMNLVDQTPALRINGKKLQDTELFFKRCVRDY
jgi:putative sugar O-methyltransferase